VRNGPAKIGNARGAFLAHLTYTRANFARPKSLIRRLNSHSADVLPCAGLPRNLPLSTTQGLETDTSDEQIVQLALAGDTDAFGEIVKRWERRIFALAYGMLGREEDARDATQETFINAFRNLRSFRGEAKVSSWLHRIAVNQCITKQRRAKVRGEVALEEESASGAESFFSPTHESPASESEHRQRAVMVRRAVNALSPELRQVILMKEFEELTFQEIADALDLPLSTVKSRLYTALRQLRMRLERNGPLVM
jgi:RNA polymerase sigma-70 factor (ECF subfamily)